MVFFFFFCVVAIILLAIFLGTGVLCYIVRHSNKPFNSTKKREKVSLCCVLGSGGHTTEMLNLLEHFSEIYTPRVYIIADSDSMSEKKALEFESERGNCSENYRIIRIPRSREVGQNYLLSVFSTLKAFHTSLSVVRTLRPDLLIVNGPGTCIPVVAAAALFDMLRFHDTTIIYEESICRVESLSLTGKILYYLALADEIIVQWPGLKLQYPRVTCLQDLP